MIERGQKGTKRRNVVDSSKLGEEKVFLCDIICNGYMYTYMARSYQLAAIRSPLLFAASTSAHLINFLHFHTLSV